MFLHMYCLMLFLTLPALSFDACVQFIISKGIPVDALIFVEIFPIPL